MERDTEYAVSFEKIKEEKNTCMSNVCPEHLLVTEYCSKISIHKKPNYFYTKYLIVLNCCTEDKLMLIMGGKEAEGLSESRFSRTVSRFWVGLKYFNLFLYMLLDLKPAVSKYIFRMR
uniref:Uncharacterized protein n=1 Tax=Sphaerodactylus townsendi TaxID=933632 RepID=A0ACB8FHK6_9SAUR